VIPPPFTAPEKEPPRAIGVRVRFRDGWRTAVTRAEWDALPDDMVMAVVVDRSHDPTAFVNRGFQWYGWHEYPDGQWNIVASYDNERERFVRYPGTGWKRGYMVSEGEWAQVLDELERV
jgi:hypothetical protein